MELVLLNGFDRSGTSLALGLLAEHPQVATLFQPFSSTEVHRSQYRPWPPDESHPETHDFLRELRNGRILRHYLSSDWFERHSRSLDQDRPCWIIKDTKLHFQIPWLREQFPETEMWGIRRDPRAVLHSLWRNGYHQSWYGASAFEALAASVRSTECLAESRPWLDWPRDALEQTAFVLAVRCGFMQRHLPIARWIDYEDLLRDPDACLAPLLERHGLEAHAFRPHLARDHNVIGLPFQRADLFRDAWPSSQIDRLDELFLAHELPLLELHHHEETLR